jgi:hypothetical protein
VEDIANHIFKKRPVGKLWAHRFVKRNPELKTCFSRSYDFQRALCEDPKLIGEQFQRVVDIKAKYGVQDCDIWNFDETGFMMGVISSSMVVTQADRKGRHKRYSQAIRNGLQQLLASIQRVATSHHSFLSRAPITSLIGIRRVLYHKTGLLNLQRTAGQTMRQA